MTVIDRLYAVLAPLSHDEDDDIMPAVPDALVWRPRADPRRWRSTDITRIHSASAALSMQHIWRRAQRMVMRAVSLRTEEMGYIRGMTES